MASNSLIALVADGTGLKDRFARTNNILDRPQRLVDVRTLTQLCGIREDGLSPHNGSMHPKKPRKPDHPNRSRRRPGSAFPTPGEIPHPTPWKKPPAPRSGRTAVPDAGKGELGSGPRQERAQVRRPDYHLHEDAGPVQFGHRGVERQIPALDLLHDRAQRSDGTISCLLRLFKHPLSRPVCRPQLFISRPGRSQFPVRNRVRSSERFVVESTRSRRFSRIN
jgi:hypothetical protein